MATAAKPKKRSKHSEDDDDDEKPLIAKTPMDLQRLKLEKLMKNPDKPVPIPERPKEKNMPHVPDFVRNVMGSSAGAGSGEFHVYRHLRRKEYARQKFIQEKADKELKNEEYHRKLEENRKAAEERTAKKRAKRAKKKKKQKFKKVKKNEVQESKKGSSSEEEDGSDSDSDKEDSKTQNKDSVCETEKGVSGEGGMVESCEGDLEGREKSEKSTGENGKENICEGSEDREGSQEGTSEVGEEKVGREESKSEEESQDCK